jgi:gliding motility-associated-like protein
MQKKSLLLFLYTLIINFSFLTVSAQQIPVPDWVKDIGGNGESKLTGIAIDKFDNVYVAGNFQGAITIDHSGVSSPLVFNSNGSYDIFVAKYTADGKLLWGKSIGGNGLDQINNLAVDIDGNVIIGASYNSSFIDCNPGTGIFNVNGFGGDDALIVKLDADGGFLWAKSIGGNGTDRGHVVTTDKLGHVIFVGSFSSTASVGSNTLVSKGALDGFMVKYDASGNVLWAYGLGTVNEDEIKSVKTNSIDEIAILGYYTGSIDLNPKTPASLITAINPNTYFLAKYTANGSLIWANNIDGTSSGQTPSSIAVGPTDDIFLTGVYVGVINFKSPSNTISLTAVGAKNLFLTKYNTSGNPIWARNMSSTATNPYSYYVTADNENNAYIGGFFDGTLTFSDGVVTKTLTYSGSGRNTFFAKYNETGDFQWSFNFGSACDGNFGHKIAVDSRKNVFLGGAFCNTVDFNPATHCALNLTAKHSTSDAYISKFNQIKFAPNKHPEIISLTLPEQYAPAVITTKKVTITVKAGTDVKKLKPTILTDIGVISPLSDIEFDFTNPRMYIIYSNCDMHIWTVEVLVSTNQTQTMEVCSDELIKISGTTFSDPNAIFQWQMLDANNTWLNAPNTSDIKDYEFKNTNNGNSDLVYTFRRKITLNGVDTYDSDVVLTLHPATVNNTINSLQLSFCNGKANLVIDGSVPLGATNSATVFIWQQSTDASNWIDINSSNSKDLSPPEFTQTTYFRRITQSGNCRSYSNILKAEVYPLVTTANAGMDKSLCNTNIFQLEANAAVGNETGVWSVVSPVTFNPFTVANINDPKATISNIPENEAVILKWTITQNDCLTQSSSQVKVFNYGVPIFSMPTNFTINEGQTLAIPATLVTNPNVSYTYSWNQVSTLDDPTKLAPNATPTETAIYHLNINYGACLLEKEIKIIVNKAIRLDVCPSQLITLIGAVDNDALSIYQWQELIGGVWKDIPNANQANFSLTTTENHSNQISQVEYRRKVINSPYYDSRYLLSIAARTANNVIQTNETIYCATSADNLLIEGSTPTGASNTTVTFGWQQSVDGISWNNLSHTSKDLSIPTLIQTTFFKRITYSDACESPSNVLKIQINPPATIAAAGESASYCDLTSISLNANAASVNETGTWKVISPVSYQPFSAQSIHDPKAKIDNLPFDIPVNLQWTIENHNCNTSTNSETTVISYKEITIKAPTVLTIDLGKKINLGVTADLSTAIDYTFEWTPSLGLGQADALSPTASPIDNTIYNLRISYGDNCFASATVKVIVLKDIEVPNSFSPNGDGINDKWEIKNLSNYPGSKVFIYNRHGSPIFESNSYAISWDGKQKGKILPIGTFYYVIMLKDGKNSVYKGSLTILN